MHPSRAISLGLVLSGLGLSSLAFGQDAPVLPPPAPKPLPPSPPVPPSEHPEAAEGESKAGESGDGSATEDEPRITIEPAEGEDPADDAGDPDATYPELADPEARSMPAEPSHACHPELEPATCEAIARAEDERVGALMASLKGASLRQRIIAYEAYVRAHPEGRHAAVLYEEAAELRKWLALRSADDEVEGSRLSRSFSPPAMAQANRPLDVAIEIGGDVVGVMLYLRDETGFEPIPMKRIGSGHFAHRFAAEEMREPGVVFYIEAHLPNGKAVAVAGDEGRPFTIAVDEPTSIAAPSVEGRFTGDYRDFSGLSGEVWALHFDGDFGLRWHDTGLRALRGGFGIVRGQRILEDAMPTALGLTEGHLELEIGLHRYFAFVLRGIGGAVETDPLHRQGTGGGRLMGRIGSDEETNVLLGAEYVAGYGALGVAALELPVVDQLPLAARFEVADQLGYLTLRGMLEVGYQIVDELSLSARFSYQGRPEGESGPGFGAGARAQW